jgi:hypothetical protein
MKNSSLSAVTTCNSDKEKRKREEKYKIPSLLPRKSLVGNFHLAKMKGSYDTEYAKFLSINSNIHKPIS